LWSDVRSNADSTNADASYATAVYSSSDSTDADANAITSTNRPTTTISDTTRSIFGVEQILYSIKASSSSLFTLICCIIKSMLSSYQKGAEISC